ncbi:hypothetical protein HYPSUDRAFT_200321 [Hypholoma sublateritium FD-334 SS-4]|uniref:Uncharacterized protein n=1 Tax=Hypholoma sublateritium (strain FD-334 SS-4) TaxID=945553 RepID=A0A0D2PZK3_HYPSF|nr:hypothetical protein HYPSUDRAFT_200321 [Hypholoma sublateritium FD-334 SS-4]
MSHTTLTSHGLNLPKLPYDLLHRIFTSHLTSADDRVDFQTLGALCLAHRQFLAICRPIQFSNVEFNFRRRNVKERVRTFAALLEEDDTLKSDIRGVSIRDNVIHTSMERLRPTVTLPELQDENRYLMHYNMQVIPIDEDPYTLVDSSGTEIALQFAGALMKLKRLRSVDISFLYFHIDWRIMSSAFQSALTNIISGQAYLSRLSLHGITSFPPHLLFSFHCLEELRISQCSMRSPCCGYALIEPLREKCAWQQSANLHRNRLKLLSVERVSGPSMCSLLRTWKAASDTDGLVDMMHPAKVQLFLRSVRHTRLGKKILAEGADTITHLQFDTSRMGRIMTLPGNPFSPKVIELEDTKDLEQMLFPTGYFQPEDVEHLQSLETLEFSIVYWENVAANNRRADVELQWALDLLQRVPTSEMRHLVLKIKVGGFLTEAEEALSDFHDDQEEIWTDWTRELTLSKWDSLESVEVSIWMLSTSGDRAPAASQLSEMVAAMAKETLAPAFKGKSCSLSVSYETVYNHCLVA